MPSSAAPASACTQTALEQAQRQGVPRIHIQQRYLVLPLVLVLLFVQKLILIHVHVQGQESSEGNYYGN
jgi:hypothetical protein